MRIGNAGLNEIGEVQFIQYDYQTRGAYYALVKAFSHIFRTILRVRIMYGCLWGITVIMMRFGEYSECKYEVLNPNSFLH